MIIAAEIGLRPRPARGGAPAGDPGDDRGRWHARRRCSRGMPRSSVWPPDPAEPAPSAATLFGDDSGDAAWANGEVLEERRREDRRRAAVGSVAGHRGRDRRGLVPTRPHPACGTRTPRRRPRRRPAGGPARGDARGGPARRSPPAMSIGPPRCSGSRCGSGRTSRRPSSMPPSMRTRRRSCSSAAMRCGPPVTTPTRPWPMPPPRPRSNRTAPPDERPTTPTSRRHARRGRRGTIRPHRIHPAVGSHAIHGTNPRPRQARRRPAPAHRADPRAL